MSAVEIGLDAPLRRDLSLQELSEQGYEAVLVAIRAHKFRTLGIEGEELREAIKSFHELLGELGPSPYRRP